MGVKGFWLCAAMAATGYAQQDPMQLLIQIRHRVADRMNHIPRYLCTETVDRTTRAPDPFYSRGKVESCASLEAAQRNRKLKMKMLTADRLRLDVAIIDNNESYSWVGEARFQDQSLSELVRIGSTSTGAFGSFLNAIFMSEGASYEYKGESQRQGRRALEYAFAVPLWRTSYIVANQTVSRRTPYSGTFAVDAQTLDLLRLEIHADSLAPELKMCELTTTLDYTQVHMNNLDFLLPSEADSLVINVDGHESLNRTVFSGCHQFMGESKLIFDDSAARVSAASQPPAQSIKIPAGLTLSIALAQVIDPAKDAAGDVVKGVLKKPLSLPASGLTIPKGTELSGRICELLMLYGEDATAVEFGIKWENMEFDGAQQPLELSVQSAVPGTAKADGVKASPYARVRTPQPEENRIGYFSFPSVRKSYRIPAGFESVWVTLPAAPIK
jgi:hypothetical protein